MPERPTDDGGGASARGRVAEVGAVALWLGLTAFGGPIAHLGYFERAYVRRLKWITPEDYAGLVALCQTLPGPASSQVGFLIGWRRAGWAGGLAALLGFTLPSAALLFAFAQLAPGLNGPLAQAAVHGLKLVAVAIVAQAVWGLGRRLCRDAQTTAFALAAAAAALTFGGGATQILTLAGGAIAGALLRTGPTLALPPPRPGIGAGGALAAGAGFVLLLAAAVLAPTAPHSPLGLAAIFYRSGALVFGGGHVVLPLLRDALVPGGWMSDDAFLAGYGAAQAIPGPLFSVAAYLGSAAAPAGAALGARLGWSAAVTAALFLPGLLIALAGARILSLAARRPAAKGALAGVNAAVVGMLGAALYRPIWIGAVLGPRDVVVVLTALLLLERWRLAPILVVGLCVSASIASALWPH